MNWYSFAASLTAALGFYLAIKSFRLDSKSTLNRILSVNFFFTALYVFLTGILYSVSTEPLFSFFLKATASLYILATPLSIIVVFVYAKVNRIWLFVYLAIHLTHDVAAVTAVLNNSWLIAGFETSIYGNVLILNDQSIWNTIENLRGTFDILCGFILLTTAWVQSRSKKRRRILLLIAIASAVVAFLSLYLKFSLWITQGYPDYSPIAVSLAYILYLVVIVRYGHLKEHNPVLNQTIINDSKSFTLFTNPDGDIIKIMSEHPMFADHLLKEGQNIFSELPFKARDKELWDLLQETLQPVTLGTLSSNGSEVTVKLFPQIDMYMELEGVYVAFQAVDFINHFGDLFSLSKREKEIVLLLKDGMENKEMAKQMCISYATVKNHIHNIYTKTDTNNRAELLSLIISTIEA